jgi:large repetitive protein
MWNGERRGRVNASAAALLLAAVLASATAHALTFTVNSTADEIDAAAGNAICATASGACTLRAAIQEANVVLGTDTIVVPAGTFQLTLVGDGDNAGITGDLDVQQEVDITGAGPDATIIDGLGADRVFHVINGTRLALSGLAVTNGAAPGSGGGGLLVEVGDEEPVVLTNVRFGGNSASQGGAVYYGGASLSITDCTFTDNAASGGGAVSQNGEGTLTILRSTFDTNTGGGYGGAFGYTGTGVVAVTDSQFTDNSASTGGAVFIGTDEPATIAGSRFTASFSSSVGGAVYYAGAGGLNVTGGAFVDNVALSVGGGIFVDSTTGPLSITGAEMTDNLGVSSGGAVYFTGGSGDFTLTGVTLVGNSAPNGAGGAVYSATTGVVRIGTSEIRESFAGAVGGGVYATDQLNTIVAQSRFIGNRVANGPGGGMFDSAVLDLVVSECTFADNRALNGPGGGLFRDGGGTATITGTTFSANQATGGGGQGGGLWASGTNPTLVTNCTLSGNVASNAGGGIYADTALDLRSSTVTGNRAITVGGAAVYSLVTVTIGGSIIGRTGVADSCAGTLPFTSANDNIDQDGSCGLAGVNDRVVDPQLGPLGDNGGPTQTHMPLAGSPAVDTASGGCPTADQRGIGRPADGNGDGVATCDVGAVEFLDECTSDPDKVLPGVCGCGVPDADANGNGAVDCLVNAELKARIARAITLVDAMTGEKTPEQTVMKDELKNLGDDLVAFVNQNAGAIVLAQPGVNLGKLAKKAKKTTKAALRGKGKALAKKKGRATAALQALDAAVAP